MVEGVDGPAPRFDLLGLLRASRRGQELELGPGKQRAVLAVLLLGRGSPVSTERIVAAVWPEDPPENGANTVQKYVAGLRRVLEPERSPRSPARLLVRTDAGYRIGIEPGCLDVDVHADLLQQARAARDRGDLPDADTLLRAAIALSRGEPLAGLRGPVFELARRKLVEDVAVARELLAEVGLAAGRHRELVPDLVRLVADFPLREGPRALLMLALYRSGRQAEALDAYRETHRFLADELGVEPGERLRELHRRILAADPGLAGRLPTDPGVAGPLATAPIPTGPFAAELGVTAPATPPLPPWSGWAPAPAPLVLPMPRAAPHIPAWPQPAPAAPRAAAGWRRWARAALAAVIPLGTTGLATFLAIGWIAARRRSRPLAVAAVGYLALVVMFFSLFDPDAPDGPDAAVGVIAWLVAWLGGTAHAVLLALSPRRPPATAGRPAGGADALTAAGNAS